MNTNQKIKELIKHYKTGVVKYTHNEQVVKDLESLLEPDGSGDPNICDDCKKETCTCYDTF